VLREATQRLVSCLGISLVDVVNIRTHSDLKRLRLLVSNRCQVNLMLTFVLAGFAAVYLISVSFLGVCFQSVSISGLLYIAFQSCIGSFCFLFFCGFG
jgi:hypothetical protein